MMKRKIIFDCDPGMDEAFAMAYLAANPEEFELLAVTVAGGMYPLEESAENARRLTALFGLDVPVAKGLVQPVVREPLCLENPVAGCLKKAMSDCLEKTVLDCQENSVSGCLEPARSGIIVESAILYLNELLENLPEGERVTVVCTGPLTNIAMLLKLFPDKKERIEEILFAGGGVSAGNITPSAEYNLYADPEAARILFRMGIPMTICTFDAALDCSLKRHQILKLCQSGFGQVVKLLGDMAGTVLESTDEKYRGMVSLQAVVPFMFLLHPEDFVQKRTIPDVDLSEGAGRGTLLCDFRWWEHDTESLNTTILLSGDTERFQEHLITALYELWERLENGNG